MDINNLKLSLNKILVFLIFILVSVLLIAIPQINFKAYVQTTITSKLIFFTYSCLFILGVCIFYMFFIKIKHINISKLDIILCLILIYITLNRYGIQSHFGFSVRYLELVGLSFIYIVLRLLAVKYTPWLLLAIVVSGIIQAIYGNLQLLDYYPSNHSGFKITGSFFNPGPYAGFLSAVWPIALGMYLFKNKIIEQVQACQKNKSLLVKNVLKYLFEYVPLLGIVSILLVIPASQSRAAWLAVLLSSLIVLELKYAFLIPKIKSWSVLKRYTMLILIITLFSSGLFGIYHFKKDSSEGRLFIWEVSTEIIKDYPVFGVGFDRFKAHYMNYQMDYFKKNITSSKINLADNTIYAFNEYLQFFVENGALGFILMLFVICLTFKQKVNKEYIKFLILIKACLISIGVFSFFSYTSQILPIKLIFIFCLALLCNINSKKYIINLIFKKSQMLILKGVLLLPLIFFMHTSFLFAKSLDKSYRNWDEAKILSKYNHHDLAIKKFQDSYKLMGKDGDFLISYGRALFLKGTRYNKAINILNKVKDYKNSFRLQLILGDCYEKTEDYYNAELAYKDAMYMIPSKFFPNYLLLKLYNKTGKRIKAIEIAQSILSKKIKVPSKAIDEMRDEAILFLKENDKNNL